MNLHLPLALVFNGVLLLTCTIAFVWGGRPEKIGAAVNLLASVVSTGLRLLDRGFFAPTSSVMFLVDGSVTASFFWLAITTNRFWPIWSFGFGLADVVLSLACSLLPRTSLFVFHTGLGLYAYFALFAMTLGTVSLFGVTDPLERSGIRRSWSSTPTDLS